ncbi:MAG: DUF475 domain-containing protein [Sphingobacteriales bacterium]|mgnify:CR=1 FL=1|jgi:YkoY family integral membrane protein|nr:DUF475 domain-containing protein [Sphingobacteriales bacterium]MBP9141243.1 DUF475 domain-containing protein [Chitinophagales bacterium]MDA0197907.1 DUF475 domain-containing protein [Bacteroidota bacterium]MBK6890863.1 DUF475 domain-containing protein [Sphingobacteriales bacterium]MBK7526084.1 DUF475 domain-containing protein [Sphingobacteriales bacterium]
MEILTELFGIEPYRALLIIVNLIIIESVLSIDNAAVIATMVLDLPKKQRGKALKYGIIGAYVFRAICLVFAAWLIEFWWLKPLGGLYLLYLGIDYFRNQKKKDNQAETIKEKKQSWLYQITLGKLGRFWATVLMVEIVDLAFSIDNVFAAVAYVENVPHPYNLRIVMIGVFIGILAMRFVAQSFVKLLTRYPTLADSAFLVIALLGLKLLIAFPCHFFDNSQWCQIAQSEHADLGVSIITLMLFLYPVFRQYLFDIPKK